MTATDRPARWTSWLQATPAELVGLGLLLTGGLAVAGLLWWNAARLPDALPSDAAVIGEEVGRDGEPAGVGVGDDDHGEAHPRGDGDDGAGSHATPGGTSGAPGQPSGEVVVHVSGAVGTPGLVTLPAGARVGDAIVAAGGAREDADLDRVNLARRLEDGEHVHLPREGEELPPGWETGGGGTSGSAGADAATSGTGADGRVDLNRATAAELETLPGIGPSRAAAIVRHREEHGPFRVPGDLREVTGIGERTFQGLADLVTVS
jgi:competence protein ComEA